MEPEKKNFFEETKELVIKYLDDQILLMKLQAAEKAAKASASAFKVIVVALLGYFILMIVTFMLGFLFSQLTNNYYIGFGIVVVIYALLIMLFLNYDKRKGNKKITDKVIEFFFSKNND
jgi:L-asparagine transporter-like permease